MTSSFDELSRSLGVRGSDITHLELDGRWGKHRAAEPGRARLYATLGGGGVLDLPRQRVHLRAGELAFLPRTDAHVVRDGLATSIPPGGSACEGMRQVAASAWSNTREPSSRLVIVDFDLDTRDAPWLGLLSPIVRVPAEDPGLGRWLRETLSLLAGAHELSPSLRQEIATTWARALFAHALRDASASLPGADAVRDERVVAALVQARARPEEDWELGALAARVGVSRSVLAERTTALLGEPLGHYLRRLRIDRAAALLESSDAPVKTIAARVGYDSESAFARAFSRERGTTPTAWRRGRRAGVGQSRAEQVL
ncbi:helix-turn-helix domain-containing protein [Pyxidicoccus sp. MSG2]|uniref:helix-turn-helix domain-containing protein n=1 Tax=Pyxidicoccus sp. MSG2 TaxID=2996790 RepID=UPI00226F8611|nr:AraC family transcriptional regulator [Pyxidicoccus sp. MSG2]MCY1017726.1 AraC family transcriptional regulator [Pyxidicoccus sp. MSG2]